MDVVKVPDEIPISLSYLKNYLFSKYKIEITINENFIKSIVGNSTNYKMNKKGKNKNKVVINKVSCDRIA